jgi:hypothetical protein
MPLPRVAPAIKHERVASPRCFAVLRGCGCIDERVGQEVLVRAALLCFALLCFVSGLRGARKGLISEAAAVSFSF